MYKSFADVKDALKGRTRRKVAHNTYLEVRRTVDQHGYDEIALRFHNTDIVTYRAEGMYLDNGGWYTATTKDRLNRFTPFNFYQRDFDWYINGDPFFRYMSMPWPDPTFFDYINKDTRPTA